MSADPERRPATRRRLLLGALALAGGYGLLRGGASLIGWRTGAALAFAPMDRPEGFRRLVAGPVSAGTAAGDPFAGIGAEAPAPPAAFEGELCEALFEGRAGTDGLVPIASFSDYNCPYCRVLTRRLAARAAADEGVAVTWHELPLLGIGSRDAARAAVAAERQGAYVAFHERLMRSSFQPTEAYLRALAADLGLDAERLLRDMDSEGTARRIATSEALGRLLDLIGTPALVVGRTVVQGVPDEGAIDALIALERAAGPVPGCT